MQSADFLDWELTLPLLIQFFLNISILLDIIYVRQILGFVYLTFIPGILLLKVLKITDLGFARSILFSVGLSIVVVMFSGLFINELYPVIGISEPLSIASLTITTNLVTILLCFISYFRNKNRTSPISFRLPPLIFPFIFLPFLSIWGTFLVNNSGNNFLLLLMIAMIPLLVTLGVISKKLFPPDFYPLAIFCIALALLFHTFLITNYIVGWDVNTEYYVFGFTKNNLRWDRTFTSTGRYNTELLSANAMLSVTVLPVIYSLILNLEGSFVFKMLYPFIFSFVPLGLYVLWDSQIEKKHLSSLGIFMSAFFIISTEGFYRFIPPKQMIAELFFVLLFIVIFDKKIKPWKRNLLFIIFSAGLVVSHYSTAYLFMFLVFFTWLSLFVFSRFSPFFLSLYQKKRVTLSLIALFFVMSFSWYIYTSSSGTFTSLTDYGDHISKNFLNDLFNPEARGSRVLAGLGLSASPSFLHEIGRAIFYVTEAFIVIGFVKFVVKRKEMKNEEYAVLTGLNMAILLMTVVIPNFANLLRMGRFYHLALLFLAPMCILGGKTFFMQLLKLKREFLALILVLILVLVPLLLFETEFAYTIVGDNSASISLSLNMNVMNPIRIYNEITLKQEVLGAMWLSTHITMADSLVSGDFISTYHVLTSYGMIPRDHVRVLSNFTFEGYINFLSEPFDNRTYIYLRSLNVVNGILPMEAGPMNITEISPILNYQNKVYSNGNSEIYNGLASPQP